MSALEEARRRDQPLACYATLLMTSEGHSLPALHGGGLARLAGLVGCGRPAAVAHLLEVVMPLFVGSAAELCAGPLPALLQTLISADQSYLRLMKQLVTAGQPGPLILQLAGVIEGHVTAPRCYGQPSAEPLAALWLRALTCVPGWSREPALLYLLNQLLRAAFCRPPARRRAESVVSELIAVSAAGRGVGVVGVTGVGSRHFSVVISPNQHVTDKFLSYSSFVSRIHLQIAFCHLIVRVHD